VVFSLDLFSRDQIGRKKDPGISRVCAAVGESIENVPDRIEPSSHTVARFAQTSGAYFFRMKHTVTKPEVRIDPPPIESQPFFLIQSIIQGRSGHRIERIKMGDT
jgi:hypothetical protein